ncbi:MAG: hypothetical protein KatS3mg103_0333 [Phycisphaerales bacterium]|nr:MAG: hypothetical protein KatS3mg103_0333 [Phycisphaerales bacterium]
MGSADDDAWYLEAGTPLPRERWSYVALGSNLGDAVGTVLAAIQALGQIPGVRLIASSRLYRTAPVGVTDQPWFVNAVAELEADCSARALLDALLEVERRFGRDRTAERRWGPRTLDLDLLLHAGQAIDQPGLTVPHPRMAQRRFVLEPLADLAPALVPPGWSISVGQRLAQLVAAEHAEACDAPPGRSTGGVQL